jgi:hypothetical protein
VPAAAPAAVEVAAPLAAAAAASVCANACAETMLRRALITRSFFIGDPLLFVNELPG